MKVLLLGGNRFVGVEIVWHLLRGGHEVTVLALDSPPAELRPHIRWVWANRNDERSLAGALGNETYDVVIDNIAFEPEQVATLTRLLKDRVGRYVLTSTTDIYPGSFPRTYTEDQVEIREFDLTDLKGPPRYMYGKRSCEAVLRGSGIPCTIFRPCIVTGPRDNRGSSVSRGLNWFEQGARSHFWPCRIMDGGPQLICREDEGVLQLIWVGDLARAVTTLMADQQGVNQTFNLTGTEIWSNERLVRALAAAAGKAPEIVYTSRGVLEKAGLDYTAAYGLGPNWSLADNAKLRATGWQSTPAEQWLPRLLEVALEPLHRPWYHTRVQEIALARHLQRQEEGVPRLAPYALPGCGFRRTPLHKTTPTPERIPGRMEGGASALWRKRVQRSRKFNIPGDGHFKEFQGGTVSSIGIGTWMGDFSAATDNMYVETLVHAANRGINLFDTAINYRCMKAERAVGEAVRRLTASGTPREALMVSTKGGYISNDAADPRNREQYIREEYLAKGLISEQEARQGHSLNPAYLRRSLEQSLEHLKLATVDLYYLHNPEEAAAAMTGDAFQELLTEAFRVLESAVQEGLIGCYGLATWDALRVAADHPRHLSLERAVAAARTAAGAGAHHLAAVQLPYNVRQTEAKSALTQMVAGNLMSPLDAAAALGLYTFTSASALQGAALDKAQADKLREDAPGLTVPMASLQMVRGTKGVGTALVGMRRVPHLEDALRLTY